MTEVEYWENRIKSTDITIANWRLDIIRAAKDRLEAENKVQDLMALRHRHWLRMKKAEDEQD